MLGALGRSELAQSTMIALVGTRYAVNAFVLRLYRPGARGFRQMPRLFLSVVSRFSTSAVSCWSKSGSSRDRDGLRLRALELRPDVRPEHRDESRRDLVGVDDRDFE